MYDQGLEDLCFGGEQRKSWPPRMGHGDQIRVDGGSRALGQSRHFDLPKVIEKVEFENRPKCGRKKLNAPRIKVNSVHSIPRMTTALIFSDP